MKIMKGSYLLLLVVLLGCDLPFIRGEYDDIGKYQTRLQAQNGAINYILKKYGSLPNNDYYKVKYSVTNSLPNEYRENAIWYNKGKTELVFEADVSSGAMCRWQEVSRTILEQAGKSANSLSKVDSLAKPDQPFRQCL